MSFPLNLSYNNVSADAWYPDPVTGQMIKAAGVGQVNVVVAGSGISVNSTDPRNPIISSNAGTLGGILGALSIDTAESTSSAVFVNLTTPESVSFSLTASTQISIVYMATALLTGTTNQAYSQVNIDGVAIVNAGIQSGPTITNGTSSMSCIAYTTTLAAGAHTVKIQHATSGGASVAWNARTLIVSK